MGKTAEQHLPYFDRGIHCELRWQWI